VTTVRVWPADQDGASGWYRMRWPAQALAAQGADVTVDTKGPTCMWDRQWTGDTAPLDARILGCRPPDADIVVLQRPGRRHWADLIPYLQAHGTRVVVDVDDDFAAIPRGNIARRGYDPRTNPDHNWDHLAWACDLADLVTVTTPALARRYGRHGRVQVLPNLVPERYLTVQADTLLHTVGWTGSVDTHPGDLEVTRLAVRGALDTTGATVRVVGTGHRVADALGLDSDPASTGWVPFADYPHEMSRFEVGIVPLAATPFNEAKSALKMGEFAALGVPVVASPTADNRRLHDLGVGLLAAHPGRWQRLLTRLLREPDRRAELAARGRLVMAGQTYERHAGRWADAWNFTLTGSRAA